jgi:hypothetical protein
MRRRPVHKSLKREQSSWEPAAEELEISSKRARLTDYEIDNELSILEEDFYSSNRLDGAVVGRTVTGASDPSKDPICID